jgi:hypothetical protein
MAGDQCAECKKKDKALQRHSASLSAPAITPPIVHEVLHSPGQSLDTATRNFMEPRFGQDFSRVRVHTDASAAESARAVNAQAYTVGRDIVFGAGQYAPQTAAGKWLLSHELTHTLQQRMSDHSQVTILDSEELENEANSTADAIFSRGRIPAPTPLHRRSILRQAIDSDGPDRIDRNFELDPQRFLVPLNAPAPREEEKKCAEFPGGSTDCEVNEATGIPTGKVTQRIEETNPCTRPCVVQHEAVHLKQLKTLCPQIRDCYVAADKGKRPALECAKMAIFGRQERECPAYKVSVPCVEKRLKDAKECRSKENKEYGMRKLASEKCFRDKACGGSDGK